MADMMRAAVLVAPGRIEIVDVAVPAPGPGEVRIRLEGLRRLRVEPRTVGGT